jgi:membrane-associated phospholipid phosphatase
MRSAEWISIAFFTLFLVAAVLAPLATSKRLKAIGIGVLGITAAWLLQFSEAIPAGAVIRDLVLASFLLMTYWQSGQFFTGSNARVQAALSEIDERWFPGVARITDSLGERRVLSTYLEAAYLMCYAAVPLGVGVFYLAGQSQAADLFWTVVLPPTYACYASTVLFQSLPPWQVDAERGVGLRRSGIRSLTLWVLRHGSIKANTFPSGHVANSLAIALVLLKLFPVAGVVFLWIAVSIALATTVLRYHYTIDAVLGAALAVLSFFLFG